MYAYNIIGEILYEEMNSIFIFVTLNIRENETQNLEEREN